MFKICARFVLTIVSLAILQFVFPSLPLYAQYENGSVLGTIRDASGAAVSGANVTVTNTATGVSTDTKTSGSGDYDIPQLRVGVYSVSATAPGFSRAMAQNITVSVGNRQRIDLTLKVGAETSVE